MRSSRNWSSSLIRLRAILIRGGNPQFHHVNRETVARQKLAVGQRLNDCGIVPEPQLVVDGICLPRSMSLFPLVEQVIVVVRPRFDRFAKGGGGKFQQLFPSIQFKSNRCCRKQGFNMFLKAASISFSQGVQETGELLAKRGVAVRFKGRWSGISAIPPTARVLPQNPPSLP